MRKEIKGKGSLGDKGNDGEKGFGEKGIEGEKG